MSSGRKYEPGDVVIGKFPYTDKEKTKERIFIIISQPHIYYWAVMLSSSESVGQDDGCTYEINASEIDFELRKRTCIRMNIIQTIDPQVIFKRLGRIKPELFEKVTDFIRSHVPIAYFED